MIVKNIICSVVSLLVLGHFLGCKDTVGKTGTKASDTTTTVILPPPDKNTPPSTLVAVKKPDRAEFKQITVDNNFDTHSQALNRIPLDTFKKELGITAYHLPTTKELGDGATYVVNEFNYKSATNDPPTLILVAGKEDLRNPTGSGEETQSSAVNTETREGIPDFSKPVEEEKEDQTFFDKLKALGKQAATLVTTLKDMTLLERQITLYREEIADLLVKDNLSELKVLTIEDRPVRTKGYKRMNEFIGPIFANTNPTTQKLKRSSLVITHFWQPEKRPFGIAKNLGHMYVVPPEGSEGPFDKDVNQWLGAIFDCGYNIIANAKSILESGQVENLAVQLHLVGGGKFKPDEVPVALVNKVFTWGIKYGIDQLMPASDKNKFALRSKLILQFGFTPYE